MFIVYNFSFHYKTEGIFSLYESGFYHLYHSQPPGVIEIFCLNSTQFKSTLFIEHLKNKHCGSERKRPLNTGKMALSKAMKRKVDVENTPFNDDWTEKYAFIMPTF